MASPATGKFREPRSAKAFRSGVPDSGNRASSAANGVGLEEVQPGKRLLCLNPGNFAVSVDNGARGARAYNAGAFPMPQGTAMTTPALRPLTPLDRVVAEADRALRTLFARPVTQRPNPAGSLEPAQLDERGRRDVAGMMRVNHVGEVCAQALYAGQAMVARDPRTRAHLLEAAAEETDHLAWCADRLDELGDRPSLLNPLWYGGAFTIGAVAGVISDRLSLGFVVETERQVEAHLDEHLQRLPVADVRSRRILEQMKADEARHADNALAAGAATLPGPVPALMRLAAGFMKAVATRI